MNNPDGWRRTSPWAALFFLGRFLRGIIQNAAQSLAPLAAFLVAFQGSLSDKLALAGIAAVVLAITVSILRYLFFRYQITDNSVLIRDGIFTKKQLDIKFDRIQGVNIQQNFVYRWFDVVNVEFDTAGSSSNEGNLPAVEAAFADALQARIDGHKGEDRPSEDKPTTPETDGDVLLQLRWPDMIKIGLADGRVLIVFALIGPFMEQMGDGLDRFVSAYVESAVEQLSGYGFAGGFVIVLGIMLSIALLLALVSIAGAFLRYHNFQLSMDGSKLRSVAGLTTKHRVSMDTKKVQRISMSQGPIFLAFKRFRIAVQQASSSGRKKEANSFKVPLLTRDLGEHFVRRVFAPEAQSISMNPFDQRFTNVSPRYIRSRTLVIGVLPLLPAAVPFTQAMGPSALILLLWPLLVFLGAWRYWQRLAFLNDDDAMLRRTGMLGYRLDAFLFRKVQRVTITQSLLQRRKGLAGVTIFLASGSVKVPYIPLGKAQQLRDYILYKVETSELAWH